nr:MAG TPA: hypothetical protein [Caudoviricetes sp.]
MLNTVSYRLCIYKEIKYTRMYAYTSLHTRILNMIYK